MTRDEIDTLWKQAVREAIAANDPVIRFRFAALLAAAEREACARACEALNTGHARFVYARAIRARGKNS